MIKAVKKTIFIVIFLGVILTGNSFAQKLEGYNGFDFGMSKDAARFICDVRDYYVDTNFTYDRDAQIPPTLSESFIYYRDSLTVNEENLPLDVTLYFDKFNGDELFNIDVSIKYPIKTLIGSQKYFDAILLAMKEKYGDNYRYSTEKDTTRLINTLFNRKFRVYDWDMDNGRVSLEHDVSSFYELDEDFYYTDKLKENGYLEVTIYYFDTKLFHRFMDSKGKAPEIEPDMKDKL